ncbi:MAG TPA: hypothetical protein PKA10_04890 [Selenomonadales bacterium]|nr:hypothetical protein [Selenomonadales bacterium]
MITPLGYRETRHYDNRSSRRKDAPASLSAPLDDNELTTGYTTLCERVIRGEVTDDEYNAALDYAVRLAARDQKINLDDALSYIRRNRSRS